LDHQLKKITLLYKFQEKEVCKDLSDIQKQEDARSDGGDNHMEQSDDEGDDEKMDMLGGSLAVRGWHSITWHLDISLFKDSCLLKTLHLIYL